MGLEEEHVQLLNELKETAKVNVHDFPSKCLIYNSYFNACL
jgi:hypothetical protein